MEKNQMKYKITQTVLVVVIYAVFYYLWQRDIKSREYTSATFKAKWLKENCKCK
jgi:preprotein translocase subunit YajC